MPVGLIDAAKAALTITMDEEHALCPRGFRAGGLSCGLRKSGKPDLALFECPKGASAAGVFTQNLLRAAPVDISQRALVTSGGRARAVMINSGCANAATGADGRARAEATVEALSGALGRPGEEFLIASTGVIGTTLQIDKMIGALPALLTASTADGLGVAAQAIMTTDTVVKKCQATVRVGARTFTVAGVAKGSGMIHPNMATMLSVILTDAAIDPDDLRGALRRAADSTFNRISVDGDTSTNDCVFALASGEAGVFHVEHVERAITAVCRSLAMKIVRDGEGAKKVIHVRVSGASSAHEADQVAEAVASSLLVRTAVAGGDPNWGRIVAAVGRSGARLDMDHIRVRAGGCALFEHGSPADTAREDLVAAFAGPDVELDIDLGNGSASAERLTCDLTEGYIRINALYTT
jgi:glutamate N-acetyltransferase/amino-acid N-acetyltransferase